MRRGITIAVAVGTLTAGAGLGAAAEPRPAGAPTCADHLCVGAAKAVVTPTQAQIDGVVEPRLLASSRLQRFHLGGFGVNPLQATPDPDGTLDAALTTPATVRRYVGTQGPEDLWVRVLVVRQADGPTVAVVTLDATGAGDVVEAGVAGAIARATGIARGDVLFSQTHTHAGPDLQGLWGGVPQEWLRRVLYPSAAQAARAAVAASTPVTLEVRHGDVPQHNAYRRPARLDPDVDTDTEATLLQARDVATGTVVASLLQYSAHPTSINEEVRAPHPDFVLGALDLLERTSGGVALYVNGAIADASPAGQRPGCAYPEDGKYGTVRCRGEGIAAAALAFPIDRTLAPTLEVRHVEVTLPVTNPLFLAAGAAGAFDRYYDFLPVPLAEVPQVGPVLANLLVDAPQLMLTARAEVSRITIGGAEHGLELVTIPGEATGTYADSLRRLARPGAHVVLLGLTHASLGYILPEEEFSYVDASGEAGFLLPFTGYEEAVSLGPLTASLLRAEAYGPLFDAPPEAALPPIVTACLVDPTALPCAVPAVRAQVAYALEHLGEELPR